MGKNILKSFVAHVIILTISWFIMMPFAPYTAERMNLAVEFYLFAVTIIIVASYIFAGTRLLLQTSRLQNWLAVMAIAVPGLIMWVSFTVLQGDLEWILFFLYYQSMAPIGTLVDIQTQSQQIIFNLMVALLPSLLNGLGLEWKYRRIKVR